MTVLRKLVELETRTVSKIAASLLGAPHVHALQRTKGGTSHLKFKVRLSVRQRVKTKKGNQRAVILIESPKISYEY